MTFDPREKKLDELFQSYRDACPDLHGSPGFMPGLWQKIESRQAAPFRMRRFTQAIVSGAAVLCMGMSALMLSPFMQHAPISSYVEALDEIMAYADLDDADSNPSTAGEITWQ